MGDYEQEQALRRVGVAHGPLRVAQLVDRIRRSQPGWAELVLEMIQVTTKTAKFTPKDLDEVQSWVDRNPQADIVEVFVRWTEHGRAAAPGMRRIALRVDRHPVLWVGDGNDEAAVQGMTKMLKDAIDGLSTSASVGVSTNSGPPLDLPAPPTAAHSDKGATGGPPQVGAKRHSFKRFLGHPWVSGISITAIGGIIAAVVAAYLIGGWRSGHSNKSAMTTEIAGGATQTFTDYTNAGGARGPTIGKGAKVDVSCKVAGFAVPSKDTWWYRIASAGWDNHYYASADAFYNNGASTGSLAGTPFFDPAVPDC